MTIAGATVAVDAGLEDDTVLVSGAVSNLATFDATGTTSVEVAAVTTTDAQSYTGATTLNGNVTSTKTSTAR